MKRNQIIALSIVAVVAVIAIIVIFARQSGIDKNLNTAPISTATSTDNTSTSTPSQPQANKYTDPVWNFSLNLPQGWGHKILENSATSSRYDALFADATKIASGEASPQPAIIVTRIDLTRTNTIQSLSSSNINIIVKGAGKAAAVEYFLGELRDRAFNKYSSATTTEKVINGKTFYQVLGTYIGISTGKNITLNDYIYIDDKALYDVQVTLYTELLPAYKAILEKAIESVMI